MSLPSLTNRTRVLGAGFVLAAMLFQAFWLGLPAIFISIALVASFGLWNAGRWRARPQLRLAFSIAVLVFLAHVTEEYLTGAYVELPTLFGRAPWSGFQFGAFNGVFALIFASAAITFKSERHLPVLIILFYAIAAGVGNGVLHLGIVLQQGAYFPGAWTAPFCFIMGVWLLRLLFASESENSSRDDQHAAVPAER